MAEVVVIGNVGVDTMVRGAGGQVAAESHFTRNEDYIGQAGAYCARGFRRLGRDTAFIGHVGDDPWGQLIRATFQREGIDVRAMWCDPAGTARSINFMADDGSRVNYYDGKGHMQQSLDMAACTQVLQGARLAHFHLSNWARHLLKPAREAGALVSCDLQDVTTLDDPYRLDFIEAADILFFSAANFPEPGAYIDYCFEHGPAQWIVVGMGERGCALANRKGVNYYPCLNHETEPVVDTNGAGDALAVGFLTAAVLDAVPWQEAITYGLACARFTCSRSDGSDQLITRKQLDQWVKLSRAT